MAGTVTTSLVVQFGSDSDAGQYLLSAEIDSRDEGFNLGNTTFIGGDSPVFLVFKSAELSLTLKSSKGGLQQYATGSIEVSEFLTFTTEKSKRLSKSPAGSVALTHFGGLTGATVVGDNVTLPSPGVAVYRAEYTANFIAFKMTNIPTTVNGESAFPVVVLITGTAV